MCAIRLWQTFQVMLDNFTVVLIMCCPWLVRVVGKCIHYILIKFIVCHHWHMAVKRGHWMIRVLTEWMSHGTIASEIFFSGFWRESVKPLQYFCQTLPISYFIDQRKLLFWRKLAMHNNKFLLSLSWLVQNRFYAIGSLYDMTTISALVSQIKSTVWAKFTETVWKFCYVCISQYILF